MFCDVDSNNPRACDIEADTRTEDDVAFEHLTNTLAQLQASSRAIASEIDERLDMLSNGDQAIYDLLTGPSAAEDSADHQDVDGLVCELSAAQDAHDSEDADGLLSELTVDKDADEGPGFGDFDDLLCSMSPDEAAGGDASGGGLFQDLSIFDAPRGAR